MDWIVNIASLHRVVPRSQAPAWERILAKLQILLVPQLPLGNPLSPNATFVNPSPTISNPSQRQSLPAVQRSYARSNTANGLDRQHSLASQDCCAYTRVFAASCHRPGSVSDGSPLAKR